MAGVGQPPRVRHAVLAGRYELLDQIGAGASALTWRARDTRLGRIVAVKLLRRALVEEPGYTQRFEREAQLAASISHPNVVDVFDVGQDDGQLYIVMQYIEGEDLKHLIEREGRMGTERAVAVAQQLLDGLDAIHRAGIIHRDIKPQNVLIGNDGIARVTDFGVAHIDAGEGLTSTGMAIGTAAYMAPEQAEGGAISEATDIYAAGVVLYEMVTGRLPFTGPTPLAIMLAHMQQPVTPPSQAAPAAGISPTLDGVVLQAMAKAPADRFRTARAMNQALTGAIRGGAPSLTTARIAAPRGAQATQVLPEPASRAVRPSEPARTTSPVQPGVPEPKRRSFSWPALLIGLLLLAALGAAGYVVANGLPGNGDAGNQKLPAIVDVTATPTASAGPTAPAAIVQRPTQPAPTETRAVIVPLEPTQTPAQPTATPTETPSPTEAPAPTDTPVPTDTPAPTETQPSIGPAPDQSTGQNLIVPAGGATNAAGSAQPSPAREVRADLAPADWQGVPLGTEGGEEVALISGAGSDSGVATLRFRASGAVASDGLTLSLRGMATSTDGAGVPVTVRVNGTELTANDMPYPATTADQPDFGVAEFHVPAGVLVDGENTLEIVNDLAGNAGEPPFIALASGSLTMRVTGAGGAIEVERPAAQPADSVKIKPTKKPKSNNGNSGNGNGNGNGKNKHGD